VFKWEKIANECCLQRTRERAIYNCPCANGSMHRLRHERSRVRPWQLLKVVVYAAWSGNCLRCTVQLELKGRKLNVMRGMQMTLGQSSICTSMKWWCNAMIWMWALCTNPFSMERFRWMAHMTFTLRSRRCAGIPGCVNMVRKSGVWSGGRGEHWSASKTESELK